MSLEISSAQTFSFSKGNVTTFPTSQKCKNFNFSLYTVLAEMLYLNFSLYTEAISPEVFNEFSKTFFSLKEEEAGYCGWKFQVHRHFGFPIATLQLFQHPENVKFQFLALHSPGRNAISPEVFNEFSKTFFSLKEEEAGYCGWKFQVHRHFHFPIATLQLFQHPENVKISIFPFTLSLQKCHISRSI